MEKRPSTLLLYAPEREFVVPYLRRELPDVAFIGLDDLLSEQVKPDAAVMLSGAEIYDICEGSELTEQTAIRSEHPLALAENLFIERCAGLGINPVILRCANTIGTGMTGWPRNLAEAIYRNLFFHFPDNQAQVSAVHATTIALAVRLLLGNDDKFLQSEHLVFNITDGVNPTVHDLAEALAFRMNQKRISTLSTWGQRLLAKLFYGKERYHRLTTTLTFSDKRLRELIPLSTESVTEYLRTHDYNEDSL